MEMGKRKIAVVTSRAIGDICGFEPFMELLGKESVLEIFCLLPVPGKQTDIIGKIREFHPNMLITADLAGFEQCTLTDNISYNLLDCKQLHLLFHDNLPNEQYLGKQLSIAMFFYCTGKAYYEYLRKQYPNLPYLKMLPDRYSETTLYGAFQETVRECSAVRD